MPHYLRGVEALCHDVMLLGAIAGMFTLARTFAVVYIIAYLLIELGYWLSGRV